jgi:hypothetical protein
MVPECDEYYQIVDDQVFAQVNENIDQYNIQWAIGNKIKHVASTNIRRVDHHDK